MRALYSLGRCHLVPIVDNHLVWPLYIVVVYTAVYVLALDVLWRLVNLNVRLLVLGAGCVWFIGAASIYILI